MRNINTYARLVIATFAVFLLFSFLILFSSTFILKSSHGSCELSVYHWIGEFRGSAFLNGKSNLACCSPHCPFNAERLAGKLFKVIGLTRLRIKPKSTVPQADALSTPPSEPFLIVFVSSLV